MVPHPQLATISFQMDTTSAGNFISQLFCSVAINNYTHLFVLRQDLWYFLSVLVFLSSFDLGFDLKIPLICEAATTLEVRRPSPFEVTTTLQTFVTGSPHYVDTSKGNGNQIHYSRRRHNPGML